MAECVAQLDGLAQSGCEDSARLLNQVVPAVSGAAIAVADKVNRNLEAKELP